MKSEIDKYRDECNQKEMDNYELTTKIAELREIVDSAVEIKSMLEKNGVDVDDLLDNLSDNLDDENDDK